VLAKAVRDVELAVERGRPRASTRSTFQAVALLVREERTRLQAQDVPEHRRNEQLKRLDGIATALARTAARDGTLLTLLTDDAQVLPDTKALLRELRVAGGVELPEEEAVADAAAVTGAAKVERQVVPASVISRSWPTRSSSRTSPRRRRRRAAAARDLGAARSAAARVRAGLRRAPSCMALPEPSSLRAAPARAHAAPGAGRGARCRRPPHVPARRRAGLGKTAQALLAAQAADAYPLLAVVPNVVKTNWAREAQLWTPERAVTVVHGDGENVDAFSDIVVVNYEVLDRHVGWFGTFGFRGMVVDEAHFIKNKSSQRSQHVLELSERIRWRTSRPLLMALTGTPLINDIDDFLAIWQFLGWIDDDEPSLELMARSSATASRRWTPTSTRPPRQRSSTSASSGGARSTSPPTSPPAASPTCRWSSTAPLGARSARPSACWPAAWSSATAARSRCATRASSTRASTPPSSAASPAGSARRPRRPRTPRTCSA
jgi:hypothetical protein